MLLSPSRLLRPQFPQVLFNSLAQQAVQRAPRMLGRDTSSLLLEFARSEIIAPDILEAFLGRCEKVRR
jgi:hypothetical protein